jgi:hypothetical protein
MDREQFIRLLDVENHQLRDEVARLSKLARERSYHARRVRLALDDALLLATWLVAVFWAAGIIPSRRYARVKGITQNRWQNALALLRMARVAVGHRRWATDSLADIERRLVAARDRAIENPDSFWARLPRHGRR